MIRRGSHSCTRSCSITLADREYDVTYRLEGRCYYDSGKVTGPPEHCYPPEGGGEVHHVTIEEVSNEFGVIVAGPELTTALLAEVNKLDLDDYLYEDWSEHGE